MLSAKDVAAKEGNETVESKDIAKKDEKTKGQIKDEALGDKKGEEIQNESKKNLKFSLMTICLRITA